MQAVFRLLTSTFNPYRPDHQTMITHLFKTFRQFPDPAILRLMMISAVLSILATSVLSVLLHWGITLLPFEDIPWIGGWISTIEAEDWIVTSSVLMIIVPFWLFIFPYVLLAMTTLFQDRIIRLVEARYYPNLPLPMNHRLHQEIYRQGRFLLKVLLINLALSPLYLILLFTGFGIILLSALINGYLIGVEYYSMTSQRRLSLSQHEQTLRKHRVTIHFYGIALYAGMLVPFLNLLIPVLGCMIMTHLFFSHHDRNSFMTSPQE